MEESDGPCKKVRDRGGESRTVEEGLGVCRKVKDRGGGFKDSGGGLRT